MSSIDFFYSLVNVIGSFANILLSILGIYALNVYSKNRRVSRSRYSFDLMRQFQIGGTAQLKMSSAVDSLLTRVESGEWKSNGFNQIENQLVERLNSYEAISLAIRKGLADEELIRDFAGSSFVRDFRISRPAIEAIRLLSNNPAVYSDFEAVARRWSDRGVI